MEIVSLANKSKDLGLFEFFDKGLTDFHSFNAEKIYPELRGMSSEEIKKSHNNLRQYAKVGNFTVAFGGNGKTVAENLNIPLEEGERFYKLYFEAYPGLNKYYKRCIDDAMKNGYILIDTRNHRKCYIYNHKRYKELANEIDSSFWERYKAMKTKDPEDRHFLLMKEKVKEYFNIKGTIERMSKNYTIQGESASISKISGIFFFKWIKDNGYLNIVKLCNFIHDCWIVECPDEIVKEVELAVVSAMEKAGKLYYDRVPLRANAIIGKFWNH